MEFKFFTTGPKTTDKKTPCINNKFSKLTLSTPRQKNQPNVTTTLRPTVSVDSVKNVSKKLSFELLEKKIITNSNDNNNNSHNNSSSSSSLDELENVNELVNPIFHSSTSENSIITDDNDTDNDQTNCSRLNELSQHNITDDNDDNDGLHTQMEKLELTSSYLINENELVNQMNSIAVLSSESEKTRSSMSSEELYDIITISDSENETESVETYNVSTIETQNITELPSMVTNKLDHFFNNIPELNSTNNTVVNLISTSLSIDEPTKNSQYNNETISSSNKSISLRSNVTNETIESIYVSETSDENENLLNSTNKSNVSVVNEIIEQIDKIQPLPIENESQDFCLHVTDTQDNYNTSNPSDLNCDNNEEQPNTASTEVGVRSSNKLSDTESPDQRYQLPTIHISTHVNIKIQIPFEISESNSSSSSNCSNNNNSSSSSDQNNDNNNINNSTNDNNSNDDNNSFTSVENQNIHELINTNKTENMGNDDENEKSPKIFNKSPKMLNVKNQNLNNFLTPQPIKENVPTTSHTTIKQKLSPKNIENKIVLDGHAQKILNELYKNTWKTPTLLKKVKILSPTKDSQSSSSPKIENDNNKENKLNQEKNTQSRTSEDFGQFEQNILLESTRVPRRSPRLINKSKENSLSNKKNKPINEDSEQESVIGKIVSTRKKVQNRIFDDSSDESENDSADDDDYMPETMTKSNKITYLDLTHNEIIPEECHDKPNASDKDLEDISQKFLEGETKKTTRRKLFTPHKYNYENELTDEQSAVKTTDQNLVETNENLNNEIIHDIFDFKLKTPLLSKIKPPIIKDGKYSFLRSLDCDVSKDLCDPNAWRYRQNFKTTKDSLITELSALFYKEIFDNKINVEIIWNKRLTKTAGCCKNRKRLGVKVSSIELSDKVITTCSRLRCTLIHELCHAATWMIDGSTDGHGPTWKYWANKANNKFKDLPKITVCHQYEIDYKYSYKCTMCGAKSQAHTKSKKAENMRCSYCHGSIEIFCNKKDKFGIVTLMPLRQASSFALFVKEQYKIFKTASKSHADVMKILSSQFSSLSTQEKEQYKVV